MYFLYCVVLFLFVYTIPGLAFFPKLLLSSRLLAAIPIVSAFFVAITIKLLTFFGVYNHTAVIIVSGLFLLIAAVRLSLLYKKDEVKFIYPKNHLILISFVCILMISFFVRMGLNSFSSNDEIYSWNMWAVKHYFMIPIDFIFTHQPYPQFFSMIISYCYQLLGNIELQMPVRCMLPLFPLAMLTAIVTALRTIAIEKAAMTILLILLLVFGTEIQHSFNDGLADPMMASALTVSVGLFIYYLQKRAVDILWLSLICGIVALNSKQPALIWSLFSFPVLLLMHLIRDRQTNVQKTSVVAIIFISIGVSLWWILGEGSGFYNQRHVVAASMAERDWLEQLVFAVNRHLLHRPAVLVLSIAAIVSLKREKRYQSIFYLLLLPSMFAWFMWGAYGLRLGIHVISICALLIVACDFNIPFFNENRIIWRKIAAFADSNLKKMGYVFISLSLAYSLVSIGQASQWGKKRLNIYEGGKQTIELYFGDISDFVLKNIYDNHDILLWAPNNYIYGIFYGHTQIIDPPFRRAKAYDKKKLLEEIVDRQPDYLFYGGKVSQFPSHLLLEVIKQFPFLFDEIKPATPLEMGYRVFRLKKDKLIESLDNGMLTTSVP